MNTEPLAAASDNGKDDLVARALEEQRRRAGLPARREPTPGDAQERSWIHDQGKLFEIARDVMAGMAVAEDDAARFRAGRYRTSLQMWEAPIEGYLGHVDEKIWRFQVSGVVKQVMDWHAASQPNGQWRLLKGQIASYQRVYVKEVAGAANPVTGEVEVVERREVKTHLAVAILMVDALGQRDIKYVMGKPVAESGMGDGVEQLLAMLAAHNLQPRLGDDEAEKLRDENADLRARLDALAAKVEAMGGGGARAEGDE